MRWSSRGLRSRLLLWHGNVVHRFLTCRGGSCCRSQVLHLNSSTAVASQQWLGACLLTPCHRWNRDSVTLSRVTGSSSGGSRKSGAPPERVVAIRGTAPHWISIKFGLRLPRWGPSYRKGFPTIATQLWSNGWSGNVSLSRSPTAPSWQRYQLFYPLREIANLYLAIYLQQAYIQFAWWLRQDMSRFHCVVLSVCRTHRSTQLRKLRMFCAALT